MPMYLAQFSYTPEAWKKLIDNPEDRRKAVGTLVEALALTATSGEGIRATEMTVLLTVEELLESLRRASELTFEPPGG